MTNGISANYSLPNMSNTLTNNAISHSTAAASGSTSGTNSGMSASNIGSTFLSLLTQELQNQDPTSPMDSTAMVGQMISLNSLSQLISINQTLSNATGASSTTNNSAVQQQAASTPVKDAAAAAVQAAAASTNPLSYLYPMNQIAPNATNGAIATPSTVSSPSAIR